jgi:serine/threonine protein kinase
LSNLCVSGPGGNPLNAHTEAWCIAKLMRLVGSIRHPVDIKRYKDEFEFAEKILLMNRPESSDKLLARRTWRKELEDIPDPPVPRDLLDFMQSLLVVDPEQRPTPAVTLLHLYLEIDESTAAMPLSEM